MKNYETAITLTLRDAAGAPKGDDPDGLPMNTPTEVDAALETLNTLREHIEVAAHHYLRTTKGMADEIVKISGERGRDWVLSEEGRAYVDLCAQLSGTTFVLPKDPIRDQ